MRNFQAPGLYKVSREYKPPSNGILRAVVKAMNRVNRATWRGAAAGTVKLVGCDFHKYHNGKRVVRYKFHYDPEGQLPFITPQEMYGSTSFKDLRIESYPLRRIEV